LSQAARIEDMNESKSRIFKQSLIVCVVCSQEITKYKETEPPRHFMAGAHILCHPCLQALISSAQQSKTDTADKDTDSSKKKQVKCPVKTCHAVFSSDHELTVDMFPCAMVILSLQSHNDAITVQNNNTSNTSIDKCTCRY